MTWIMNFDIDMALLADALNPERSTHMIQEDHSDTILG